MTNIIVTTPEELKAIVNEAVSELLPRVNTKIVPPDTITLSTTLSLLDEQGFPTSKAKIYKLTSAGKMPHRKYGNKLVFSRKEVLAWANGQTKSKEISSDSILFIARSAKRKK